MNKTEHFKRKICERIQQLSECSLFCKDTCLSLVDLINDALFETRLADMHKIITAEREKLSDGLRDQFDLIVYLSAFKAELIQYKVIATRLSNKKNTEDSDVFKRTIERISELADMSADEVLAAKEF